MPSACAASPRTHYALAFARIECHYFVNGGFFDADDQLIRARASPARHPGRDRAWPLRRGDAGRRSPCDLARAWPEADLRIVADAGHAMTEPGIVHELVAATNRFAG